MSDKGTEPAHLSNLQAEIARKVLTFVKEGRWAIGEHVSEQRLSEELGTSRSPVRHVLQYLTNLGLFTKIPNVGFRLTGRQCDLGDLAARMPHSQFEDLYEKLMIARINGEIGNDVSETELAERFGRTRGMVRRTLMRFAAAGLAERRTGHGWSFAETLENKDAINESYAYRVIIECGALREHGFAPRPDQLAELLEQQTRLYEMPVRDISGSTWFDANANFHATLVSWAHNRFLTEAIQRQNSLRRMTEYAEFQQLSEARIKKAARDHLSILEAVKEGDKDRAHAILYGHLSRTSQEAEERRVT